MIKKFGSFYLLSKTGSINTNNIEESINKSLSLLAKPEFFAVVPVSIVCSKEQVFSAVGAVISSFKQNASFSQNPGIEFLLHLTACQKISQALDLVELPAQKRVKVLLVIVAKSKKKARGVFGKIAELLEFIEEKGLIEKNIEKNAAKLKKVFGISRIELKAMNDLPEKEAIKLLVLERQALLALKQKNSKNLKD